MMLASYFQDSSLDSQIHLPHLNTSAALPQISQELCSTLFGFRQAVMAHKMASAFLSANSGKGGGLTEAERLEAAKGKRRLRAIGLQFVNASAQHAGRVPSRGALCSRLCPSNPAPYRAAYYFFKSRFMPHLRRCKSFFLRSTNTPRLRRWEGKCRARLHMFVPFPEWSHFMSPSAEAEVFLLG